jgi:hypothetical protein
LSDAKLVSADYYREKAVEIRQFARRCQSSEICEELFELAERFDRMAAAVEKRRSNREPHHSRSGQNKRAPEAAPVLSSDEC